MATRQPRNCLGPCVGVRVVRSSKQALTNFRAVHIEIREAERGPVAHLSILIASEAHERYHCRMRDGDAFDSDAIWNRLRDVEANPFVTIARLREEELEVVSPGKVRYVLRVGLHLRTVSAPLLRSDLHM